MLYESMSALIRKQRKNYTLRLIYSQTKGNQHIWQHNHCETIWYTGSCVRVCVIYDNFEKLTAYSRDLAFSRARLNITSNIWTFDNYYNQTVYNVHIRFVILFNINSDTWYWMLILNEKNVLNYNNYDSIKSDTLWCWITW